MAELDYLVIPVSESLRTQYEGNNPELFSGNNLIIRVLPDSYRVADSGVDYSFFEGLESTYVMVERTDYQFSVSTLSVANALGLILQTLINESLATVGEVQLITVRDYLFYAPAYENQGYETRKCTMKFKANSGTATTITGQKIRSAGYLIEFRQLA